MAAKNKNHGLTLVVVILMVPLGVTAETLAGRAIRVVDGDTAVLLTEGNVQERIRLSGIDLPESKQVFGIRAKKARSYRVAGETVTVEGEKRDRYKRIVGKIVDDEGDVNLALVRSGMCCWYRRNATEQSDVDQMLYNNAEDAVRSERIG